MALTNSDRRRLAALIKDKIAAEDALGNDIWIVLLLEKPKAEQRTDLQALVAAVRTQRQSERANIQPAANVAIAGYDTQIAELDSVATDL